MQVELLRDLYNIIINEKNKGNQRGIFCCFEDDYVDSLPFLKKIFLDINMNFILANDCKITKTLKGFVIKDFYGGEDIYSLEEAAFLVDLWDRVQDG